MTDPTPEQRMSKAYEATTSKASWPPPIEEHDQLTPTQRMQLGYQNNDTNEENR